MCECVYGWVYVLVVQSEIPKILKYLGEDDNIALANESRFNSYLLLFVKRNKYGKILTANEKMKNMTKTIQKSLNA